jgi:hypothetical protein
MTRDLLNSHSSRKGKILNALDFPLPLSGHPPLSLSSDMVAWRATALMDGCDQEFPESVTRWGLAATAGAYSSFHIDTDGLATYVDCVNQQGSKWWLLVGPKDSQDFSGLANYEKIFGFHNGSTAKTDVLGNFQIEAVLLTPGTRL